MKTRALHLLVGLIAVACGYALWSPISAGPPPSDSEILSVFVSTGGPAPGIDQLTFTTTGSVAIGPIGHPTPCGKGLAPEDLALLRQDIAAAKDVFLAAWVSWSTGVFSDVADVTFLLDAPPQAGAGREISIPIDLFPVSLLPLAKRVDDLAAKACASTSLGIVTKVNG